MSSGPARGSAPGMPASMGLAATDDMRLGACQLSHCASPACAHQCHMFARQLGALPPVLGKQMWRMKEEHPDTLEHRAGKDTADMHFRAQTA